MTRTEREWWQALAQLLQKGDLTSFWAAYATYLQERNIISTARHILHSAALQTFMRLQGKWITTKELSAEGWYWYNAPGRDLAALEILYSDVKEQYYCIFAKDDGLTWCSELNGQFMLIPEPEINLDEISRGSDRVDVPQDNV